MGYQALYRAWRPQRFSDVVGQTPIITTLIRQITTGRIAHAYLFCGSRGTGKTSTAKVFARAINCADPGADGEACGRCAACVELQKDNNMDVVEIDAASNNGVDEIRALREKIVYPPSVGRYKVYIIDEVHMLSTGAFNALLKTLEEPPGHAVFILATTEPNRLPATILSRCQRFDFKRIPASVIAKRLDQVLKATGATAEPEAIGDIARAAEGGMRDALSLMDMCLSYGAGTLTASLVREVLGASDRAFLFEFVDALIDGDARHAMLLIDGLMMDGRDPAVFSREVVSHLRALLVSQIVKDELADLLEVAGEDAERYRAQSARAERDALMRWMQLFMNAESDMKWAAQQRAVIELCAMRACYPQREAEADALLGERVAKLEAALKDGAVRVDPRPAKPEKPRQAEGAKAAEKAPAPGKAPAPKADAAPAGDASPADDASWQKAKALVQENAKACYPLVVNARFVGAEGDVATIELTKANKMYKPMFDKPTLREPIEQALCEAFGRAMKLSVQVAGDAPRANAGASRQALSQAFDAFGRENVVIIDE